MKTGHFHDPLILRGSYLCAKSVQAYQYLHSIKLHVFKTTVIFCILQLPAKAPDNSLLADSGLTLLFTDRQEKLNGSLIHLSLGD